jgi:hypothetical protein
MGREAGRWARAAFDWSAIGERTAEVYRGVTRGC